MLQQQGQSGGNAVSSKEVDLAYNALGQFTTIADFNYLGQPSGTGPISRFAANQRLTMLQQQGQSGGNTVSPKEVDLALQRARSVHHHRRR